MPPLQQLLSFHIIERDKNNQNLMTWTYPSISEGNKSFIINKITQLDDTSQFFYLRNKKEWIYLANTNVVNSEKLVDIKQFVLVIISKDFYPYKYETLGKILSKCYYKTGNPVELVKLYLSVYTTGTCSMQENGTFAMTEFENNNNIPLKIKDVINMFGLEIIFIYTAMLLKKRIVVYHHCIDVLQKSMQSLLVLTLHRNPNEYFFPLIEIIPEEILDLKSNSWFVAGFIDSSICNKTDMYDLLVNLPALEISVMPHAKESLTMTKAHKDIAISMVQMAENPDLPESDVAKVITNKTQELLNQLRSLGAVHTTGNAAKFTVDHFKSKNLNVALENFLLNLAAAENFLC